MANDKKQLSSGLIANDKNEGKPKTYSSKTYSSLKRVPEEWKSANCKKNGYKKCEGLGIFLCC